MKQVELHAEVRFHLLNGQNYRKWQVNIMQGKKRVDQFYVDPTEYQLETVSYTHLTLPTKRIV